MRSLKIYFLIFLVLLVSYSCKSIFSPSEADENGNNAEKCDYPLYPDTGDVGSTIRSCHFEVTLNWTQRTDKYNSTKPMNEGNNLVATYLRVKLIKLKKFKPLVQMDSFKIKDNTGNTYSWTGRASSDSISSTFLSEGQEVGGTTIIEVPKSSSGFTIIFFIHSTENPENPYKDEIKFNLGF